MTALEIGGEPVDITSAELCWIQHWSDETPAQREWEVAGRTKQTSVREGVREILLVFPDRRLKGRGIVNPSVGPGLTVIEIIGLGGLVEVRD
jgi:hypothetical protein